MAITITADPILTLEDAQKLLSTSNDEQLRLVINAVSAKFLQFTGRKVINYDENTAVVERVYPTEPSRIWLAASPIVTEGKTFTAESMADGVAQQTYTLADGELEVISAEQYAYIIPVGWAAPLFCDRGRYVQLTYYGGWSNVPGDVTAGAVQQAQIEIERFNGKVGMSSVSRHKESVQYDRAGVIQEAAEAWSPYVV